MNKITENLDNFQINIINIYKALKDDFNDTNTAKKYINFDEEFKKFLSGLITFNSILGGQKSNEIDEFKAPL